MASTTEPLLAHMVYFTLVDNSPAAIDKLIAAAHRDLSGHPGTVHFSVGKLCGELDRPVNVRDWDVGLHVVFENKAAHDQYQTAERHLRFVAEGKPNWKQVRVFDSLVTSSEGR